MSKQILSLEEFKSQFQSLELEKEGRNILNDKQIEGAWKAGATPDQVINAEDYAKFISGMTGQDEKETIDDVIATANANGDDDDNTPSDEKEEVDEDEDDEDESIIEEIEREDEDDDKYDL